MTRGPTVAGRARVAGELQLFCRPGLAEGDVTSAVLSRNVAGMDALVFDFDGTIVDTESAEFAAISEVWAEHDREYPIEQWMAHIGTTTSADWVTELAESLGRPLDRDVLHRRQRKICNDKLLHLVARPGVLALFDEAQTQGLKLGVASNAPRWWVEQHLTTLGVVDAFAVLMGVDTASAPKPDPAPYREACEALGTTPERSVAFEDSMTGVHSAVAAGCFTVACRGPLTFAHDLSGAHRLVPSLADVTIDDLRAWRAA
jgi:HAD superfamily hydrolase (TIGR01509 family)